MANQAVEAGVPDAVAKIVSAQIEKSLVMPLPDLLKLVDGVTKQILKSIDEHNNG